MPRRNEEDQTANPLLRFESGTFCMQLRRVTGVPTHLSRGQYRIHIWLTQVSPKFYYPHDI